MTDSVEFEVLIEAPEIWVAVSGPLAVSSIHGICANDTYQAMLHGCLERSKRNGHSVVLCDARHAGTNSIQRKMWTDFVRDNQKDLQRCWRGMAFVASNQLIAGAVRAISWVIPPPFPQTATSDIGSAYEWCKKQMPERTLPSLAAVHFHINAFLAKAERAKVRAAG